MNAGKAIALMVTELERAEAKHPGWPEDLIHRAAIVSEEAGELVRACLQHTYEFGPREAIAREAAETGAMAIRFLMGLDE